MMLLNRSSEKQVRNTMESSLADSRAPMTSMPAK